ncbi:hypothetical protein Hdeb2414_s0006g00222011 [Helianthus debilis subsp. tardiflorus]
MIKTCHHQACLDVMCGNHNLLMCEELEFDGSRVTIKETMIFMANVLSCKERIGWIKPRLDKYIKMMVMIESTDRLYV